MLGLGVIFSGALRLIFNFVHVGLGHADHDEVGKDVEEEYGHAHKKDC